MTSSFKCALLACLIFSGCIEAFKDSFHFVQLADVSDQLSVNSARSWLPSLCRSYTDNCCTYKYGIIIDAGSTGSRVHIFEFIYNQSNPRPFVLHSELFDPAKPGLSSFVHDPKSAPRSLHSLVETAKRRIPISEWRYTPIALRATAGLRMLSSLEAGTLLTEVEAYLKTTPFKLVQNGVSLMSGLDEGIYSWITLNFLRRSFQSVQLAAAQEESVGALDLGGGSTQITFVPEVSGNNSTVPTEGGGAPLPHVIAHQMTLFSHSFAGLGLMAARLSILQSHSDHNVFHQQHLMSPCLPDRHTSHWEFNGQRYHVMGAQFNFTKEKVFQICYESAKSYVNSYFPTQWMGNFNKRPFYAFSYYFDIMSDARLIDSRLGGTIYLEQIFTAAQKVCSSSGAAAQSSDSDPFLCLNLAYVYSLLHDGYRFQRDAIFHFQKKINGVELSWSLGALFDVLFKEHLL